MRFFLRAVPLATVLLLCSFGFNTAHAQTTIPEGTYQITLTTTGAVEGSYSITKAPTANGAPLDTYLITPQLDAAVLSNGTYALSGTNGSGTYTISVAGSITIQPNVVQIYSIIPVQTGGGTAGGAGGGGTAGTGTGGAAGGGGGGTAGGGGGTGAAVGVGIGVGVAVGVGAAAGAAERILSQPFGGRITFLLPCANAAIYTIVANFYTFPLLVPVPLPLIWTTFTATSITPPLPFSYPPTYIGEQILGTFDFPWLCYIPPFVFLPGLRMQTERPDIPPFP